MINKVLIIVLGLLFSVTLNAQRGMKIDERVEALAVAIELSEQQQKEITVILTDQQKKVREIRDNFEGDQEELREKLKPLRKETNDMILKILTPEQQTAYKNYLKEQRKKFQQGQEQE